ncbi:MAG: beta/gamma crystallin domain-containing protein [Burkholderiaceae bacterium]
MKAAESTHHRPLALVFALSLALAAPLVAAANDKEKSKTAAAPPATAPVIVLVPVSIANTDQFGNGCWARLYDSTDFKGNQLSLVGPVDMPDMTGHFGIEWGGSFDSIAVGPKATLTVYDAQNYKDKAQTFKAGQKVPDLDEKMGLFESIQSVKMSCTKQT